LCWARKRVHEQEVAKIAIAKLKDILSGAADLARASQATQKPVRLML
jgi:hypothetical protein